MAMRMRLFESVLRAPHFRGKGRVEKLARGLLFASTRARVGGGLTMELDVDEWPQIELLKFGGAEPLTVALLQRLLREGDTYVDVGAHVGFHTLVARRCVGASGRVVAVEPQPYGADRILRHWRLNGFSNIVVYVAAAGAAEGRVELRAQAGHDASRLSLLAPGVNDERQPFIVGTIPLATVFREQGLARVRLLKIDVEGYEPEVVAGLGDALDSVDHLVLEVLDAEGATGARSRALLDMLMDRGFRLRSVAGTEWRPGAALAENNVWASRP
jgi:FkbM family methyltransferase